MNEMSTIHDIEALRNTISNIANVPLTVGHLIFSYIQGDYENINADAEKSIYISETIENSMRNSVHNDVCTRNEPTDMDANNYKWNNKDDPVSCHKVHFYNTVHSKHGVSDEIFKSEIEDHLKSSKFIGRFVFRGKVDKNALGYYFYYNKNSRCVKKLKALYHSDRVHQHHHYKCCSHRIPPMSIRWQVSVPSWDYIRN